MLSQNSNFSASTRKNRTLVIGLDGATFDILKPVLQAGRMPNLQRLMDAGVSGPLASVLPTNSAAAWCSFATGKLPSRHGIFEFRQRVQGSLHQKTIVNATYLRDESLWRILTRHERRIGVVGVPLTYPPASLNGFMVTGLLTPKNAPVFTYPENLSPELRAMHGGEYIFDVEWANYQGRQEALIQDLDRLSQVNLDTTLHLARSRDWDLLITVFVSPDRLQHCFWPYMDPTFPHYDAESARRFYPLAQAHFGYLDQCIGRLLDELADAQTTVMVMSDHGFQGVYQQMNLDDWLAGEGLLKYRAARQTTLKAIKKVVRPLYRRLRIANITGRVKGLSQAADIDWGKSRAYCTWDQQQGISINLQGRDPLGVVSPGAEYEQLLSEIEARLRAARHPQTGQPLFVDVIRGKDYYKDPIETFTPDLIVLPGSYLRVAAPRQRRMYDSTGWATGDHAVNGIFVAHGPHIRSGAAITANLIDLAPTILHTLDLPIPQDMDGQVLGDVFEPEWAQAHPPVPESREAAGDYLAQDEQLSTEDEQTLIERLEGLGYL